MEFVTQLANAQFLLPAAAVAVVLICAALVFSFGFKTAEQPQFDKLPLLVDDRKASNKKRKTKEKKPAANGVAVHNTNNKSKDAPSDAGKKSPAKEKVKEQSEKIVKPKDTAVEPKLSKKEAVDNKLKKKGKNVANDEKPLDFDEGDWEQVPKKNEKKKTKNQDDNKKESPSKDKKKLKGAKKDDEKDKVILNVTDDKDKVTDKQTKEEVNRELREKVNELQRVLREAELRDMSPSGQKTEDRATVEPVVDNKEVKEKKKKEKQEVKPADKEDLSEEPKKLPTEKVIIDNRTASEAKEEKVAPVDESPVVFDELGDVWNDAKTAKKGKKKARKDQ